MEGSKVIGVRPSRSRTVLDLLELGLHPFAPRLVRMQRQSLRLEAHLEVRPKARGVRPVLEPDNEIIAIAHDDNIATGVALAPLLCPQVQDMVQVDVREQRRDHRAAVLVMGASPVPGP